jgi:uncharacterized protein with FMN-binding domain
MLTGGFVMKKVLSLVMAGLVSLSLSACAIGNNREDNGNRARNNTGTDVRRLTQQNNNNVNVIYRDGVYTGYGNAHANGNEMATVTIRNGRITDIDLDRTNQQGGTNNTTGTRTGNRNAANNQGGTTNTEFESGYGLTPGTVAGAGEGTGIGRNNTTGTGNGGTIGGAAGDALNGVRTRLITDMIQYQRSDVTVENTDSNLVNTVNNWKLAVRRALDQAR